MKSTRRVIALVTVVMSVAASPASAAQTRAATDTSADSLSLRGGEDATVFGTLTVEGEDRVRITFERPSLDIELDPLAVGGLEWVEPAGVVDRAPVDLLAPFLASTRAARVACAPRPWLMRLPAGPVARFRPDVSGVDRWQLIVVDSRGTTVARFGGEGKPPKEIAWDGRTLEGTPASPGLTYSHALEAYDEAGNKRSFAGEGFELPAYAVVDRDRVTVLIPGRELTALGMPAARAGTPPALLLEAATRLNATASLTGPVRIAATARSFDHANSLATGVAEAMADLLLGDPLRIQPVADVQPDCPVEGSVAIIVEG